MIINHTVTPIHPKSLSIKIKTTLEVENLTIIFGDPHDYKKTKKTWKWQAYQQEMTLTHQTQDNHFFECIITPNNARGKYAIKINSNLYFTPKGYVSLLEEDLYSYFFFPYIHQHEIFTPPSWVKDQIWCQIFVDRFSNGDPSNDPENVQPWDDQKITSKSFYGGDLRGIINHLDHLKDIGFTALYLTPIFLAPSNHKYDTINYLIIDPHFGSFYDLRELIDECHKREMKIMLDAVFNHSGYHHPLFQDVVSNKELSQYKDYFHITSFEPLNYETFSITKMMPKLNTFNPILKQELIDVLLYYLREFNIDGWRFDVANELDFTFIREINRQVKSQFPEAYLLAEIWHDPTNWIDYDLFDGNMDYEQAEIFILLINQKIDIQTAIDRLVNIDFRTPLNRFESQFHLIDSHDTKRLMTMVNNNEKAAYLNLFLLALQKGSICLFYGTNYLLEGENDPYCRQCYPLQPTQKQLQHQEIFKKILQFRKDQLDTIQNSVVVYKENNNKLEMIFTEFTVVIDFKTLDVQMHPQLFSLEY